MKFFRDITYSHLQQWNMISGNTKRSCCHGYLSKLLLLDRENRKLRTGLDQISEISQAHDLSVNLTCCCSAGSCGRCCCSELKAPLLVSVCRCSSSCAPSMCPCAQTRFPSPSVPVLACAYRSRRSASRCSRSLDSSGQK